MDPVSILEVGLVCELVGLEMVMSLVGIDALELVMVLRKMGGAGAVGGRFVVAWRLPKLAL